MDNSTQHRAPPSIIPTRYQVTENPALPIFIPHPLPFLASPTIPLPNTMNTLRFTRAFLLPTQLFKNMPCKLTTAVLPYNT
jgi:hypothetical protein